MIPTSPSTAEEFNRFGAGFLPAHLGIQVTQVQGGEVHAHLDVQPFLLAPNGFLHAGSVVTLADTASVMIGEESRSCFWTTGGSMPGGSRLSTPETASRTSCTAASTLRSSVNVTMTNERPSLEIDRSSSIPATVATASSMICVTSDSASSAAAPG